MAIADELRMKIEKKMEFVKPIPETAEDAMTITEEKIMRKIFHAYRHNPEFREAFNEHVLTPMVRESLNIYAEIGNA